MRNRVKEHFPTVLLTLLSIVQALALELLWSHLDDAGYLFEVSWSSAVLWMQYLATLLAIILIWVIYVSNVMRFRWVPATIDSAGIGIVAMCAMLATLVLLATQFYLVARFWEASLAEDDTGV